MKKRLLYASSIAVNICFGILVVSVFRDTPFDESPVPFGTSVLPTSDMLLREFLGSRPDGRLLIVFGNDETFQRHAGRLSYLNSLVERVSTEHFQIIFATVEELQKDVAATINQLQVYRDRSGRLHRSLHFAPDHPHGGVALVNGQGAVEFRTTTIPSEDVLRRLAEKHAFGSINYRPVSEGLLSVFNHGGVLPNLSVQPASAAALRVQAFEPGRTIVLFASSCAPCVLNEYLGELGALKARFSKRGYQNQLAAVFDESFDPALIADQLDDPRIPALVYRANLRQLVTSKYETRTDALAVPLVITMGEDNKILFAEALRIH